MDDLNLCAEDKANILACRQKALATALEAFKKLDINSDGHIQRAEIIQLAQGSELKKEED